MSGNPNWIWHTREGWPECNPPAFCVLFLLCCFSSHPQDHHNTVAPEWSLECPWSLWKESFFQTRRFYSSIFILWLFETNNPSICQCAWRAIKITFYGTVKIIIKPAKSANKTTKNSAFKKVSFCSSFFWLTVCCQKLWDLANNRATLARSKSPVIWKRCLCAYFYRLQESGIYVGRKRHQA